MATDPQVELMEERERVRGQVASLEGAFEEFVDAADLVATDDEHDPEGHTIAFERQQVAGLLRDARRHLAALDAAVKRVADGTYGRCATCGGPIGEARLAAIPSARECIGCAW